MEIEIGKHYIMSYRNWRGEIRDRKVKVVGLHFKVCPFHSKDNALYVSVFDLEKEVVRDFLPADIRSVREYVNRWQEYHKGMTATEEEQI